MVKGYVLGGELPGLGGRGFVHFADDKVVVVHVVENSKREEGFFRFGGQQETTVGEDVELFGGKSLKIFDKHLGGGDGGGVRVGLSHWYSRVGEWVFFLKLGLGVSPQELDGCGDGFPWHVEVLSHVQQ